MRARIFLVDDCTPLLRALERLLRHAGHEVHAFPRASLCDRCRCPVGHACTDVLISDVAMPGHSGLEFIENQREKGCKAPHMALASGHWSADAIARAEALGCRVFQKPVGPGVLLDWIESCVGKLDPDRVLEDWFLEHRLRAVG